MAANSFLYQHPYAQKLLAEGRAEGKAEGKTEGKAATLLLMLDGRCIALSDDDRARIESCTDEATLDSWIKRALDFNVSSIEEVIG
ncbi:hypothetical protein Aph01nite_25200 [Acrocarpospora phusangensis]|uniref:Uncharacterized protein n=1 Tax=Acrocarpospora phusangensis TaxID=1070424 RepID=A0A919QBA4_9ACTN|nr:hypothetical protein [Acrocarpospora phusangensis]GIH24210.1 hypothetical protein Aph01nite_25200 [Acrocarpospora phusangensis]